MGFLRRIAGILGLAKDDASAPSVTGDGADDGELSAEKSSDLAEPTPVIGKRRGFSVQVPVAVDRPTAGPVLAPCSLGEGGAQGFRWYARKLRIDNDGDVADEFLDEMVGPTTSDDHQTELNPPRLQVKFNTRPTALSMRKQTVAQDGNILQSLEYQGQIKWV